MALLLITWDAVLTNIDGTEITYTVAYEVLKNGEVVGLTHDTQFEVNGEQGDYFNVVAISPIGERADASLTITYLPGDLNGDGHVGPLDWTIAGKQINDVMEGWFKEAR